VLTKIIGVVSSKDYKSQSILILESPEISQEKQFLVSSKNVQLKVKLRKMIVIYTQPIIDKDDCFGF
jgi:hypothetical protein